MSQLIPSTSAPDLGIVRAGFLQKQKRYTSGFSERYFVLTKTELHRFERKRKDGQAEDLFGTPKHSMKVRDITTFEPIPSDRCLFEIKSRAGSSGKQYAMTLRAKNSADASAWLESIGHAKRAARRRPLQRKNTISGNYLPSPGGADAGSMDETSIETPGAPGSPAGWDTKGSPAQRTAAATVSSGADRVTLISQRISDAESVLALFPSPTAPTSLTGVAKKADIVVTLASGARYKVAASKCQKANSKVLMERFEGPGFASMCATPPEVWIHFHGGPRRNKRGAPTTPRPAPSAGGAMTTTGNGCNHFKWALLGAVPMTLWFCAASEAQTRYICAALLSLTILVQFILSRFLCRAAVLQAGGAVDAAAAAAGGAAEQKLYDHEAICEIIGTDGSASPSVGSDPSTPGTPRSPSAFAPVAPAMAPDQLTELSLTDPRARIEALLRNGGLEDFTDETGNDMGTEESSPFSDSEMEVARRVCDAIFIDYQSTYDNLPTKTYDGNSVATPPVAWADKASGTYHPAALVLDSTLLVGFIRGYAVSVSKKNPAMQVEKSYAETIEALVKSLSWRIDLRTATTLEEELPFVKETFAMWPNLMYGCDDYGHTIMAERISTVKTDDIQSHYKSADHIAKTGTFYDILRVRAQILEAIARKKREISIGKGFRTHKMLLIVDMSGLSLGRVKSMIAAKNAVQMIFSLGSDNYPETMRRIYIVNAPFVFNMLFKVASSMMDPVTVEKVQMVKSPAKLIEAMKRDDIDYDQMPSWLGGLASHEGTSMEDVGREYVQQFALAQRAKEEAAAAAAPAAAAPAAAPQAGDSGAAEKSSSSGK